MSISPQDERQILKGMVDHLKQRELELVTCLRNILFWAEPIAGDTVDKIAADIELDSVNKAKEVLKNYEPKTRKDD